MKLRKSIEILNQFISPINITFDFKDAFIDVELCCEIQEGYVDYLC